MNVLIPWKKVPCLPRLCISNMPLSTSTSEVVLEKINQVGVITLNKPKVLNALNLSILRSIYPKLKEWEKEVSFVMIKGVGEKAFCAGGDIKDVTEAGKRQDPSAADFFRTEYNLNHLIGTLKIPYVALIHGITMGGGVGLSIHGKYRVATEKTVCAMPETAIGLFPDVGSSYFLPRLPFSLGTYLGLTGFRLKGVDVMKAGIATHFCDSANLNKLEKELLAVKNTDEIPRILEKYTKESRHASSEFSLMPHLDKIAKHFSLGSVEEILFNLRKDETPWSKEHIETLRKMSPTSLKVTIKLLREGIKKSSLRECLQMEFRVVCRFLEGHDFYEGVRAVLIEKDNKPSWRPQRLEEVSKEKVEAYFVPLSADKELQLP